MAASPLRSGSFPKAGDEIVERIFPSHAHSFTHLPLIQTLTEQCSTTIQYKALGADLGATPAPTRTGYDTFQE